MAQPVTRAIVSLLAGAALSAALTSAWAMLFMEIPIGDAPRLIVRTQNFTTVFPWAALACGIVFLALGPPAYLALRRANALSLLTATLTGGIVLSLLSSLISGEFVSYLNGAYFVIGALGSVVSWVVFRRPGPTRSLKG